MYEKFGFVRVGTIVPEVRVGDIEFNCKEIIKQLKIADKNNISIVTTPELSITGYTCQDLFGQQILIEESINGLKYLLENTKVLKITYIIGMPIQIKNKLYNCAVVINKGNVLGIVPKTHLPNENEFYERRWFSSSKDLENNIQTIDLLNNNIQIPIGTNLIFQDKTNNKIRFSIEICEDLWVPNPPSNNYAQNGANIIFNLSASNEILEKAKYREELIKVHSNKITSAYIYASAGMGESTTDTVFAGHSIIAEDGKILTENKRFELKSNIIYQDIDIDKLNQERLVNCHIWQNSLKNDSETIECDIHNNIEKLERKISQYPFIPNKDGLEEILEIQTSGLAKRLQNTKMKKTIIGLSGGLDSTLAFLIMVRTYNKLKMPLKDIIAVQLPCFGTSKQTFTNSEKLAKSYNVTLKTIDIKELCTKQMSSIGLSEENKNTTYENIQARQRTQILMNLANLNNGLVIGTGDLSELALGWCTYNGDHMSMYSVNSGIPKTLVRKLVEYIALKEDIEKQNILSSILDTPISPELLPTEEGKISQQTEQIIGDYKLHDFFLYHFLKLGERPNKIYELAKVTFKNSYDNEKIKETLIKFITRFFRNQFKRNCMPDGPKVGCISLNPRADWKMPSDAELNLWINNIDRK